MPRASLIVFLIVSSVMGLTSAFAQSRQLHWSEVEEVEAECETALLGDGLQEHVAPYWYKVNVARFVAVSYESGQWCVDENSPEFKSGFAQYFENSDSMKKTIDDHIKHCAQARTSGGQQCQQRQQWFSYAKEKAHGVYSCAPSLSTLLRETFPGDQCGVFKLGKKNSHRFL